MLKNTIVANWGEPVTPLLPKTVRELWKEEVLPIWLIRELGLPVNSTYNSLGALVWKYYNNPISATIRDFLVKIVRERYAQIANRQVLDIPPNPMLFIENLPFSTRTRNCVLHDSIIGDTSRIGELTYNNLLKVPNIGMLSMIEYVCVVESENMQLNQLYPVPNEIFEQEDERSKSDNLKILIDALDATWVNQISASDPRFADVLRLFGKGTIFELINSLPINDEQLEARLANAILAIESRIKELSRLSLDEALLHFVKVLSNYDNYGLNSVLLRLGWLGEAPLTLDKSAVSLNLTRERMRQIEKKVLNRVPKHPIFMPCLDEALEVLGQQIILSVDEAGELLKTLGLSSVNFHPLSLISVAKICGRQPTFDIRKLLNKEFIFTCQLPNYRCVNKFISIAKKQASASGVTNIQEVIDECQSNHVDIQLEDAKNIIHQLPEFRFLYKEWFWYPVGTRNRLRNVAIKMLSVVAPIHISVIREGAERSYRGRRDRGPNSWPLVVPDRHTIESFFRDHNEFVADSNGNISPTRSLDYRECLDETEQIFVDVLRSTQSGVINRASFAKECIELGMNRNTFNTYLSFSCILSNVGKDIWALRGVRITPFDVEAVRKLNSERVKLRRVLRFGWSSSGNLWIAVRIPDYEHQLVFGMPADIKKLLIDKKFNAVDEQNVGCGTIVVNQQGSSYGYNSFLNRKCLDEDNVLLIEFDLVGHTCVLKLCNDEFIDGEDSTV